LVLRELVFRDVYPRLVCRFRPALTRADADGGGKKKLREIFV
jgi:hypothetical protein